MEAVQFAYCEGDDVWEYHAHYQGNAGFGRSGAIM